MRDCRHNGQLLLGSCLSGPFRLYPQQQYTHCRSAAPILLLYTPTAKTLPLRTDCQKLQNSKSSHHSNQLSRPKNQLKTLNEIKAQRKLKSKYDDEGTRTLLENMDRDIAELEATIDVDVEEVFKDSTAAEKTGNSGLSSSDVDLIDEL